MDFEGKFNVLHRIPFKSEDPNKRSNTLNIMNIIIDQ